MSSTIVEPIYTWLTARAVRISVWTFARGLSGVVQASLLMLAALLAAKLLLFDAGVPAAVRLGVLVALGVAVYLPCCAWRAPEVLDELRQLRGRRALAESTDP